jgi:hypothetical protein
MDVGYLKIKIDIKAEYDEYRKKHDYKRKEIKKEEIKRLFEAFKDFFKQDGHFKFKENEHSITAEYKDHGITLDIDLYKNIDSPDFNIEGFVKTYEKDTFEFIAEGISNKEMMLEQVDADEQEKMVHATRFYKDFLEGDLVYNYRYRIKGREEIFASMNELLLAL